MDILVISSYPEKGSIHSKKTVGVASYTKSLLTALIKGTSPHPTPLHQERESSIDSIPTTPFPSPLRERLGEGVSNDINITVLAEQFDGPETYSDDGVTVNRFWQRGNIQSILKLFRFVSSRKENVVVTSFEIYMFGSPLATITALFCLLFLRVFYHKKIILIMHQVLSDFSLLEKNLLKVFFLNFAKNLLYKLILLASTKIVVFEEQLKAHLLGRHSGKQSEAPTLPESKITDPGQARMTNKGNKVMVIPHFVASPHKIITKNEARKGLGWNLDEFYLLYFGYIAPYKGIDTLVQTWPTVGTEGQRLTGTQKEKSQNPALHLWASAPVHLVVAGGANPNHEKNAAMKQFVANVTKQAKAKNITITGFVDESQVPLYFSACDAVILPYKTFMSSSGPLSLAFSYEKPALLSEALAPYAKTADIAQALKETHTELSDMTISLTTENLPQELEKVKENIDKLTNVSRIIKEKRSIEKIAEQYKSLIFNLQF